MSDKHLTGIRLDIQALRAIAVLSVVLFHLNENWIPGGFVGVDIFFVISGYLITGQLWRQVQHDGKVNFKDFWARRARRLLPASLLVILVTILAVFTFLPKGQLARFSGDGLAATFYVANWHFIAKSTDYLEDTAAPSPFQHFWSLSVEEQYYIIWPFVLFICLLIYRRFNNSPRVTVVAVLTLISLTGFAYSVYLTELEPAVAYFSTLTRSWEFAVGAVLSIALTRLQTKHLSAWVFWLGIALVIYSLVTFNSETPFPSFWAGIPVLGTLLVIAVGDKNSKIIPRKLLALKPVQFFGNISYSLYLWHWPLLILAPWVLPGELTIPRQILLLTIAICLATVSKKFVEDPVRFGAMSRLTSQKQILATSAMVVAIALVSISLVKVNPAEDVQNGLRNSIFQAELPPGGGAKLKCFTSKTGTLLRKCVVQNPKGSVRVALLGDSHMRQYNTVMLELASKYDWQVTMISKSSCPIQDIETYAVKATDPSCKDWNANLAKYFASAKPFDLIFNSNATFYTKGNAKVADSYAKFVEREVQRGTTWILIKDNPKPMRTLEACLYTAKQNAPDACAITRDQALTPPDVLPDAVLGLPNTVIVDTTDLFCTDICKPVFDGKLQYLDFSHITWRAAQRVVPLIEAAIPPKFKKPATD